MTTGRNGFLVAGLAVLLLAGPAWADCGIAVTPEETRVASANRYWPSSPGSFTYTVANEGDAEVEYTVALTDEFGDPDTYTWLEIRDAKTGGIIPEGESDQVIVDIIDTDLPEGTYTAYVTFTDDCVPANKHIRRIDLVIAEFCLTTVNRADGVFRSYRADTGVVPSDFATYRITNAGTDPIEYTVVTEDPDTEEPCTWVELDRSGGGPLNASEQEIVQADIKTDVVEGLADGFYTCHIKFTDDCDPPVETVRALYLTVWEPSEWVNDFTNWTGQDLNAVSQYDNPQNPLTPLTFSIIYNQNVGGAAGWLTQGRRGGDVPTTAKFLHPVPGSGSGRARFGTTMPDSMTLNPDYGLSFAWKARYGNYAMTRAPVQLQIRDHLNRTQRPFFRVQNGTTLQILRNGGGAWGGIDPLTLPTNVANPQKYHDWSVSVVMDAENTTVWHWKVWLNGELLKFGGLNGAHEYPLDSGDTWSFKTNYSGDDGTNSDPPQFRLGELENVSTWNFEFDCIAYRDDLNDGEPLYCMKDAEYCGVAVSPVGVQKVMAYYGEPAVPESITYTISNFEDVAVDVKVEISYDPGNPGSSTGWLELDIDEGQWYPVAEGASASGQATITNTTLEGGVHTAYLTFTDRNCDPANPPIIRQIDLEIVGCLSRVTPTSGIYRTVDATNPEPEVDDVLFTFTNLIGTEYYTVEEVEPLDCTWLTLSKGGAEPLGPGESDVVTAEIDPDGLAPGLYTCEIRFTDDCDPAGVEIRTVHISVRDETYDAHWYAAEFMEWTGQDFTAVTPLVSFPNDDHVTNFTVWSSPSPQDRGAPPGWITQGLIGVYPTTAKFSYNWFGWARAALVADIPLHGDAYDPTLGLAWVWRQKLGNYSAAGTDIRRGPIELLLPVSAGDQPDGSYSVGVTNYTIFVNIVGIDAPVNQVRILGPGATGPLGSIEYYTLPESLVDRYHLWSASGRILDGWAWWNLWIDGEQLMFGGIAGSVEGPDGRVYSFRTNLTQSAPWYLRYGELGNTGSELYWNKECDYIRITTLDVAGAPYWDGTGWGPEPPPPLCPPVWADANRDGVIDQQDFAYFQACYTGPGDTSKVFDDTSICFCFDRDEDGDVDGADLTAFEACAAYSGPGVPYDVGTIHEDCLTDPPGP